LAFSRFSDVKAKLATFGTSCGSAVTMAIAETSP
jgi:hypothetical protein